MNFVSPTFLFALFAIAIPIIIHLFNFRKFKKIYFTNVRFLQEIKQETQSHARLKYWLVLLSRILTISFLVFAFSQPYIPSDNKKHISEQQNVSIFIDNSFSMDAVNDNGRLFEQAKHLAREIANAYQTTDHFQLLTNDFESRHQRIVNRDEMLELIDETDISPSSKKLSEVIARQKDALLNSKKNAESNFQKTLFIISDFQKTMGDFSAIKSDTSCLIKLIPVQAQLKNNLYIDSCWFASPVRRLNQPDELHIRIVNKSENNYENVPIKLTVNGQVRAIGTSFSLQPNSQIDTVLNFTSTDPGWQNAVVEITDYPIVFDDRFFLSYNIAGNIRILSVNAADSNQYIHSLFGKDAFFSVKNFALKNIDYSAFPKNNMLIVSGLDSISSGLAQELKRFTDNGGSVLIFPSEKLNFNSYKDFFLTMNLNYYEHLDTLKTKVSNINFEHGIFENVFEFENNKMPENMDLPVVQKHFVFSKLTQSNEEWLLKMQNGNNFLSRYSYGKGFIYLSSVPLNTGFSNFEQHAIFVPALYQLALHSMETGKLFYTIGEDNSVEINPRIANNEEPEPVSEQESILHITSENKMLDFIPERKVSGSRVSLFLHNQISQAGNYFISSGNTNITSVAFNYNRRESDMNAFTKEEIQQLLNNTEMSNFSLIDNDAKIIGKKLNEINEGIKLWKYCIIFALVFLAAEVILLRWWK